MTDAVFIGSEPLTIEDVVRLAHGRARPRITEDSETRARIAASVAFIEESLASGRAVYGITTGFGASAEFAVSPEVAAAMPLNLLRYHGCGTGRVLTEVEAAAVVATRLAPLARGWSGVRLEVLERLCVLLERRILPAIPAEGSVGASGDLTPLSYVAALLVGERECWREGHIGPAAEVLADAGLEPLALAPKESLALMNGTSVMTALGCLAFDRARRLGRLASALTAMTSDVLYGLPGHFDDRIFALKPHPGQRQAATWIREGILARDEEAPRLRYAWVNGGAVRETTRSARIQDRYSIRCAPHVIGVLLDALPFTRQLLETELNGVNDNPLIDPEAGEALHGGNFYGGHACLATDTLKNVCANVADLLDRQLALLNNPLTNEGLPANLVGRTGGDRATHHGFKAMEISASALTAEALKTTMPASVFSRSTESHNQDKVSMGTISAREALRVLELTETVAVIHLLALCQAVDLRGADRCHPRSVAMRDAVRREVPMHDADRNMDVDIEATLARYRAGDLPVEADA
ncbi:MAG: aromatic amino acid ammonia-lyase [Myxococcota bacterium]|nr:aromatic amino acid ammonia-lyase [Myxococcota bacterium]